MSDRTSSSDGHYKPEWFYKLSAQEQRKQVRRWRYYRRYLRIKFGDRWELMHALEHA